MCETIFAWLWRLYPEEFREAYRDEALRLFKERAQTETGVVATVRLWLDLIFDLAISLLREYRRASRLVPASPAPLEGVPAFEVIESGLPRPSSLFIGAVLSLAMLATVPSVLRTLQDNPAAIESIGGLGLIQPEMINPAQTNADSQNRRPAEDLSGVNAEERHRVIAKLVEYLNQFYFDHNLAQHIGAALLAHEKNGDYAGVTNGAEFAKMLTHEIREVSHDLHLVVAFSRDRLPDQSNGPTGEQLARYRQALEAENCTFAKVEVLAHNIGYLKLDSFPDPRYCESTAKSAMASLNNANAIIFDLRDNHGGYPSMVMMIAAYLFDHPQYMYRPEATPEESMTTSPVAGNRLADKPVFVLTSSRTFSGAEHFSYDLKMLKRATLVGDTTGGATDVGVFHRIDDHFGMGIRERNVPNPYPEADWAVVGVQPNVRASAAEALNTAENLARRTITRK